VLKVLFEAKKRKGGKEDFWSREKVSEKSQQNKRGGKKEDIGKRKGKSRIK